MPRSTKSTVVSRLSTVSVPEHKWHFLRMKRPDPWQRSHLEAETWHSLDLCVLEPPRHDLHPLVDHSLAIAGPALMNMLWVVGP